MWIKYNEYICFSNCIYTDILTPKGNFFLRYISVPVDFHVLHSLFCRILRFGAQIRNRVSLKLLICRKMWFLRPKMSEKRVNYAFKFLEKCVILYLERIKGGVKVETECNRRFKEMER